jgi:hypothetical protein
MKIASYNAACKRLKLDPVKILPKVTGVPKMHKAAILATFQLFIICQASWAGVKIDWNNSNQYKWRPWWDMEKTDSNPTGFRFFDSYCTHTYTTSSGGSRICFPSEADCEYHAKKHIELFRAMMVIE